MDTEGISQGEVENDQVAVSEAVPRPGDRRSWPGGQSLLNTQACSRVTKGPSTPYRGDGADKVQEKKNSERSG